MPTRLLRLRLVLVTAVLIATATLVSGANLANAGVRGPFYVAMGDSRAATPTYTSVLTGDNCGRTPDAYPNHVARILAVTFRSVACTGVTSTEALKGKRVLWRKIAPQVDALSADTRLITVSIGGNDINWWNLVSSCFAPIATPGRPDMHCRDSATVSSNISAALATLPAHLSPLLREIHRRAPSARVFVVGHGGYYGTTGCSPDANMSNADARFVADFFARFNAVLQSAADRAHDRFVDIATPAVGHDACTGSKRWFVGNAPNSDVQIRHTTPLGSANMAALIVAAVRAR